jgi:hypothetical protein
LDFHKLPCGYFFTNARRVGDNVMIRTHDIILPNMTQVGPITTSTGEHIRYFARASLTRWVVPLDNTNTRVIAWRHFNDKADPVVEGCRDPMSLQIGEIGQLKDRPYEERQRHPSDHDAFIGQGPINIHKLEHLATSDRGVALFRTRIRKGIRAVANGDPLPRPDDKSSSPIPTYCGETVVKIPRVPDSDDSQLLLDTSRRVAAAYRAADALKGNARNTHIEGQLNELFRPA